MKAIPRILMILAASGLLAAGCGDDGTGSDGGDQSAATINGNVIVPDAWAGRWEITLTFRDCTTGQITGEQKVTSLICPGDTVVNPFSGMLSDCDGTISDGRLSIDCDYSASGSGCTVDVDFNVTINRTGDQLSGSGQWSSTLTGTCPSPFTGGCENIQVSGLRLSSSTAGCDTLQTTVARRFRLSPLSRGLFR